MIRSNAERILSLQRPDGQWSMRFEADAAGGGISDGPCALGACRRPGFRATNRTSAKAIALSAAAPADVRRMDGSAAIIRELPHAIPGNANGNSRR